MPQSSGYAQYQASVASIIETGAQCDVQIEESGGATRHHVQIIPELGHKERLWKRLGST
jgi:hypothetical protein